MTNSLVIKQKDNLYANLFDRKTVLRGKDYYNNDHVKKITISDDGFHIASEVSGTARVIYDTDITLSLGKQGAITVEGYCKCPVGYNCKHVYATLLKADEQNPRALHSVPKVTPHDVNEHSTALTNWLKGFTPLQELKQIPANSSTKKEYHLLYLLSPGQNSPTVEVAIKVAKCLVKGGYGKPYRLSLGAESHKKHMKPADHDILAKLEFCNRHFYSHNSAMKITGPNADDILNQIIETGRCYWQKVSDQPVNLAKNEALSFKWNLLEQGNQRLDVLVQDQAVHYFALNQLWYFDAKRHGCGKIETELPTSLLTKLLDMPVVPVDMVEVVRRELAALVPEKAELLPNIIKSINKTVQDPIPVLTLSLQELTHDTGPFGVSKSFEVPVAEISFDYDGHLVPFSKANKSEVIRFFENDCLYEFKRNFLAEKKFLVTLNELVDLEQLSEKELENKSTQLIIHSIHSENSFLEFIMETIPALEQAGWRIVRNDEAFVEVLFEEDLSWYSELDDESSYDYFGYSLGIIVDDTKIDILPLVANLAKTTNPDEIANIPDTETIPLPLPNGKLLAVPFARIKSILQILVELYDTEISSTDSLKLSKRQASLLFEIEQAFKVTQMRWIGGSKLRSLGKKLAAFKSIKNVKPPKTFKAELRKYQQEGVNWLQFLREYQMNGILADDMGLGKTVQTLAHLCIEKNRRRMSKPVLIIAPTSLMVNWQNEAAKFVPSLKTMLYHGADRHQYDHQFRQFDLIFTTYPLLFRDKEVLLAQEFYYVILDEAQYIKNHKAKSTQIVHQLKAEQRLCLTGTPMENHLTELWSLFNFLMPGILGNATQFKQLFRNPIEKNNDTLRQKALSKRIKPFLLRRKKEHVLEELPEKTVMVSNVELQGAQRDLYESIRLAMEKKVRSALQDKGLAKSHIIILDAILKLRQVCCHPKLLKLDAAKKAENSSAKMNLLMEMLPNMVEEGRKILVFSQFTKMLAIIEKKLDELGLTYSTLTGATVNRKKAVNSFQEGNVPIFLISLKAGGTGLNLTAADTVIHYDPWWNPSVEDQATDRAHRIGQMKSVFVYKLIASGTIEETIHEMQQKKRNIITGLLSENTSGRLSLTADDLNHLFKPI